LEFEHVDFLRREITVRQQVVRKTGHGLTLGPPKSASSYRVVELPTATATALARHVENYPPADIDVIDATEPAKIGARTARLLFPSATKSC
jgi:hypothetical protein